MNRFAKYWSPVIVWAGVIFLLSSSTGGAGRIPVPDFVLHALFFGAFALLLYRALVNSDVPKNTSLVYAVLGTLLYGAFDEFHQSFVPGRDSTINDVVFDTIGALLVVLILWKLLPKAPKRLKHLGKSLELD